MAGVVTGAGGGSSELAGQGPAITDLGTAVDPAELARALLRVAAIPANMDVLDAAYCAWSWPWPGSPWAGPTA